MHRLSTCLADRMAPRLLRFTGVSPMSYSIRTQPNSVGPHIDTPQPGERGTNILEIGGWVIGRDMPIATLKLLEGTSLLRTISRDVARPDVAQAFPGVVDAHAVSGFSTKTSLLGLPDVCQLSIRAVFEDGREIPLAVIHVNRSAQISERASLNPLMVSALGRSKNHAACRARSPASARRWTSRISLRISCCAVLGERGKRAQPSQRAQ